MLWPQLDESTGRRNLRRELARLREAGGDRAIKVNGDFLQLAPEVACDVQAFEANLADGRADDALAHWHGAPADGLTLDDAAAFEDWLAAERERLLAARRRCRSSVRAGCAECSSARHYGQVAFDQPRPVGGAHGQ